MRESAAETLDTAKSIPMSARLQFVNQQAGIEHAAVKMGVNRNEVESAVRMVRKYEVEIHDSVRLVRFYASR